MVARGYNEGLRLSPLDGPPSSPGAKTLVGFREISSVKYSFLYNIIYLHKRLSNRRLEPVLITRTFT